MPITSKLMVGEPFKKLSEHLHGKRDVIVITDFNVNKLYDSYFPSKKVIIIGTGEGIKNLDTVSNIYERLMGMGADRSSFILAVGGGLVCDVAGFAASTFMRGLDFAFVPTTLLAQVDAALGGKNGVNFKGYKNIVGVFNQPEFIFYNFQFLKTLSTKEYACGISETIKHSLIAQSDLLDFLETDRSRILAMDELAVKRIVSDSVKIKSNIVNIDEFEEGERRKLNFGHTIGHALEKVAKLSHGEAVAVGMAFAARYSHSSGLLAEADRDRVERIINAYGLPLDADGVKVRRRDIIEAIRMDKKKDAEEIHFVFLKSIGEPMVTKIPIAKLEEAIFDLC